MAFACSADSFDGDEPGTELRKGDPSGTGKGGKSGKGNSGKGGVIVGVDSDTGGVLVCDGKIYACGDMLDNDGDGLVDYEDPECTTPCDHDEGSFLTDLAGQNEDCKSDCYFDDNTGAGDDDCNQNLRCDPEDPGARIGCEYDPELMTCPAFDGANPQWPEQSDTCIETCEPLVPNGCDCFGCCMIGDQTVYLDGSPLCSLEHPEECQSCTFNFGCANLCEPESCELCVGQTLDALPDECNGEPACPLGVDSCGSHAECSDGHFCQTGCCIAFN